MMLSIKKVPIGIVKTQFDSHENKFCTLILNEMQPQNALKHLINESQSL